MYLLDGHTGDSGPHRPLRCGGTLRARRRDYIIRDVKTARDPYGLPFSREWAIHCAGRRRCCGAARIGTMVGTGARRGRECCEPRFLCCRPPRRSGRVRQGRCAWRNRVGGRQLQLRRRRHGHSSRAWHSPADRTRRSFFGSVSPCTNVTAGPASSPRTPTGLCADLGNMAQTVGVVRPWPRVRASVGLHHPHAFALPHPDSSSPCR